jgi:hypothetical protein
MGGTGGGGGGGTGGGGAGGTGGSGGGTVFSTQVVTACAQGGTQNALAVAGDGTVGVATIAQTSLPPHMCGTGSSMTNVAMYQICYAELSGSSLTTAVIDTLPYTTLAGLGIAFGADNHAAVAYLGFTADATLYCGANDLYLASGRASSSFTKTVVATGSQSSWLNPETAANCVGGQCNMGNVTGLWPAVGFRSSGATAIVFRDIHFGFGLDDYRYSDVEFSDLSSIKTIDVGRGGGDYSAIAFDGAGNAVVVYANSDGAQSYQGVWINRESNGGQSWTSHRITDQVPDARIGFAISSSGLFALAFHAKVSRQLVYLESQDGTTWSTPFNIDLNGDTGQFPSLAFAANGAPAVSYYRCNDYHPGSTSCDPAKDGLYYAVRDGTNWRTQSVVADPQVFDGLYTALGFVGGKAVIAYQTKTPTLTGMPTTTLSVAKEE